jgi:hypothetical protein
MFRQNGYLNLAPLGLVLALAADCRADGGAHMLVPPADLVTLEMAANLPSGCGKAKLDFFRVLPDGTSDPKPFRVPAGRALVVTDVDWHYHSGAPGLAIVLSVLVQNLGDADKRHRAVESVVRLGPDGVGGAGVRMTSGFVVSPAARVCVDLINAPTGDPLRLSRVLLRGYLTDQPETGGR